MRNNFWFGVLLTLSICFVCFCFVQANATRETPTMGSEVFTIALPLAIVFRKIMMLEKRIQRKSEYIKNLEKQLNL